MPGAVHIWGVYLLRCADGSLYAGCTNRLEFRLSTHNLGKGSRYTRSRLPVTLAYWRPVRGRSAALKAEAKLKGLSRAEKLLLVEGGAQKMRRTRHRLRGCPSPSVR